MLAAILTLVAIVAACAQPAPGPVPAAEGIPADAAAVIAERGLTPDDVYSAVKTYMPTGQYDPYIMFASGGQGGQVLVVGVPSMRILRLIGVFTPEPWQGYGYGGASAAAGRAAGCLDRRGLRAGVRDFQA